MEVAVIGGGIVGCAVSAADVEADAVVVAAGVDPGTGDRDLGCHGQIRLERPPRQALEEAVIEELTTMTGEVEIAFAAVTAGGVMTLGATFLVDEPDHRTMAPTLVERAGASLRGAAEGELLGSRACARPVSVDGYTPNGILPDHDNPWIATGNGPRGMSCGPATARIAVDAMLGRTAVPSMLDAAR